jgi:hypothetical protein
MEETVERDSKGKSTEDNVIPGDSTPVLFTRWQGNEDTGAKHGVEKIIITTRWKNISSNVPTQHIVNEKPKPDSSSGNKKNLYRRGHTFKSGDFGFDKFVFGFSHNLILG